MDDLERELREMLDDRVAAMPETYHAPPVLLQRARRRRATKLTALAASMVVVIGGAVGVIATMTGDDGPRRVVTPTPTSGPPRPRVSTVECPANIPPTASVSLTPPSLVPRVPDAGDPAELAKLQGFATAHPDGAVDDRRWIVLGPSSWSCLAAPVTLGEGMVVYDPNATPGRVPSVDAAPVAIVNDRLWRDPFGPLLACSVFDDQAVRRMMSADPAGSCLWLRNQDHGNEPPQTGRLRPAPPRTVTRVNDHVVTFVDSNGNRGAAWMILPSSKSANDGKISVLTCRPTEGLTAAACDTIVADYVARLDPAIDDSRPGVRTVGCAKEYPPNVRGTRVFPSFDPRVPTVGDPAVLSSLVWFAESTDQRGIALGPESWACNVPLGRSAMVIYDPAQTPGRPATVAEAPITVVTGFGLWTDPDSLQLACSVFDDRAVSQSGTRVDVTQCFDNRAPRRSVTRVDKHVATFVDDDGSRGMGWLLPPSTEDAGDGVVSVLTCRPTEGLTVVACDTIIADYVARLDAEFAPPTTTEAPKTIADAPFAPGEWVSTDDGFVISDRASARVATYYAAADIWDKLPDSPFGSGGRLFAARGFNVFVIGSPASGSSTTTPFAMADAGTERWKTLAPVPVRIAPGAGPLTSVGDSNRIFGVGGSEGNTMDIPPHEVMLMYDIAQDRWTRLPPSPLSPRSGATVQWTGKELLVWGGGNVHEYSPFAFPDGAAYDPASGKWQTLPTAPVPARNHPASVWTGTEMLVWGGSDCQGCGRPPIDGGAAYDPQSNRWRKLAPSPLTPTFAPAAVWTGTKMVVLGQGLRGRLHTATYDPATDTWATLPDPVPDPSTRGPVRFGYSSQPFVTWTDHQAIFGAVIDLGAGRDELAAFSYTIGE